MQLSEAMKIGAMALRPVHGPLFSWTDGEICAACALGAAVYAAGAVKERGFDGLDTLNALGRIWPWTETQRWAHPIDGYQGSMKFLIIDLFEHRGWTREQIADYIATIEPQEDAAIAIAQQQERPKLVTVGG